MLRPGILEQDVSKHVLEVRLGRRVKFGQRRQADEPKACGNTMGKRVGAFVNVADDGGPQRGFRRDLKSTAAGLLHFRSTIGRVDGSVGVGDSATHDFQAHLWNKLEKKLYEIDKKVISQERAQKNRATVLIIVK